MPECVLLDNDVMLKVSCYSLVGEMLAITTVAGIPPAILGVGRFVIRSRLNRRSNIADIARAGAAFDHILRVVSMLEPDDEELEMAANLEAEANRLGLELDGGESQLLAILSNRVCRLLITGDKRAIAAMALVALDLAGKRVGCLEQLMALIVRHAGVDFVRSRVCAEPRADLAVTACFSCSLAATQQEDVLAGLSSYIGHLDRSAPGILVPDGDIASIAA